LVNGGKQIMHYFVWIVFVLAGSFASAAEAPLLSWETLFASDSESSLIWDNQIVRLRGFLYPKEDSKWVLAAQPNLRSCCIGNQANVKEQIRVEGDMPFQAPNYVGEGEGLFRIKRLPNQDPLIHSYALEQARLISPQSISFKEIGLVFFLFLLMAIAYRYRKKLSSKS
jgi:hypothetical protein